MKTENNTYQIVWLIRRLFRALGQKATERLESLGISASDRAVMEFLYPDKALSVPEIAKRYKVSRQHIQTTVNSLLKIRLVVTKANPRHRRSPLIKLNKKGEKLFSGILKEDKKIIETLFSDVSEKDIQTTKDTLELLLNKL